MKLRQMKLTWARAPRTTRQTSLYRTQGDEARGRGDWHNARLAYEGHLKLHPDDFAIWVQFGHALKQTGFHQDALAAYLQAKSLDPANADLLLNIGHLYRQIGQFDQAIAHYSRSAELAPGLFGGLAMIEVEKMMARVVWRRKHDRLSFPRDLPSLLTFVRRDELAGTKVFSNYFRSFQMR